MVPRNNFQPIVADENALHQNRMPIMAVIVPFLT